MKKISMYMISIIALFFIIAGCSQSAGNETANSAPAEEKSQSDYPTKPIEMIIPTPPGGGADNMGRILAQGVAKYLPNGQNVVVVNKPGGNNTIGVAEVFKAKPDGYTIGFVPSTPITNEPHFGNTPYSHDSFQPILRVAQQEGFMYVRSDSEWETYDEWFKYVQENPGKFKVGSVAGVRNLFSRLNHDANIDITFVPFDGFAESTTALLGGHVDGTFAVPAAVQAQVDSGEFRPIFTSSSRGDEAAALVDNGLDIVEDRVTGVIAPKGLPEDILQILHDAFKQTLEDPEIIEQLKNINVEPYYGGPEEYQQVITAGFESDGATLKVVGAIE